jgi:hypothetical protein
VTDEVELVSDGEGILVTGHRSAVEGFLHHVGLVDQAQEFDLSRLGTIAQTGASAATAISGILEQSGMYLKLTPESAKRLKDAGGLMKTKTKGVSHAMLGKSGKKSLKWLQVEDGQGSLLMNPAVLAGVGGIMSQLAQQSEAQELKALLVRIDQKLDDVRRAQRDEVLAKMRSAAAAIDQAMIIRSEGGDPKTLWDKVNGSSEALLNVQEETLLALSALADKVEGQTKTGKLKRAMQEIEHEIAVHLAVLARCFELQDQFGVVELEHVLATAPEHLDGHRRGVAAAREKRRASVLESTSRLMTRIAAAGDVVNDNILLHVRAARYVIDSLNATAASIDDFHAPLGIESARTAVEVVPWRQALRDPQQLRTAGKEAGQKSAVGVGAAIAVAASGYAVVTKSGSKPS